MRRAWAWMDSCVAIADSQLSGLRCMTFQRLRSVDEWASRGRILGIHNFDLVVLTLLSCLG